MSDPERFLTATGTTENLHRTAKLVLRFISRIMWCHFALSFVLSRCQLSWRLLHCCRVSTWPTTPWDTGSMSVFLPHRDVGHLMSDPERFLTATGTTENLHRTAKLVLRFISRIMWCHFALSFVLSRCQLSYRKVEIADCCPHQNEYIDLSHFSTSNQTLLVLQGDSDLLHCWLQDLDAVCLLQGTSLFQEAWDRRRLTCS